MKRDYAERARRLIGTRFRPQGRDDTALDCVGLVLRTFDLPSSAARRDYRLRGEHLDEIEAGLLRYFRHVRTSVARSGDVMLMSVTPDQLHLGVCTPAGFVHADAGIGRVVETPGVPRWPVVGMYRRRAR
jgi:hypothetical protein